MKRYIFILFLFCTAGGTVVAQKVVDKILKRGETVSVKAGVGSGVIHTSRQLQDAAKRNVVNHQKTKDIINKINIVSAYNKDLVEKGPQLVKASKAVVLPPQVKNSNKPRKDKFSQEQMLNRFLSYVVIESQSIDEPDMNSFPMTFGQKLIAQLIYNEVKSFGGSSVKVTLSDDYYVYIDIPSNIKEKVPSILFMAHMDVTPEAPGKGIKPMVHRNYDGGDIKLPGGITLSPNSPQGAHLKDLVGKTIVTSDGTTLLGADDKTGCAVLVSMVEELIKNPNFQHGRVMVALSQNEDVGKAAMRYDPKVFGDKPDIVIDIDGSTFDQYSIANFTAIGQTYYFKGNKAHPSYGKKEEYGDALSAASYFIGLVPPEMNPSAREGKEGYVHCYSLSHPLAEAGKPNVNDYAVKVRLRYFDQQEGAYQKKLMDDNLKKVQAAFPFVEAKKTDDQLQYENIAYSMPDYVPGLVKKAAHDAGMDMREKYARGGTTSAMMVARYPDVMPGGCDFYSGQNAEHSCYEWCCIEELVQLVEFTKCLISEVSKFQ